jgi:hypothetical protein
MMQWTLGLVVGAAFGLYGCGSPTEEPSFTAMRDTKVVVLCQGAVDVDRIVVRVKQQGNLIRQQELSCTEHQCEGYIEDLLAGTYTFEVDAMHGDRVLFRSDPVPGTILPATETTVSLLLQMKGEDHRFTNHAPMITSIVVADFKVTGKPIHLAATAIDVDPCDEPLEFRWTASWPGECAGFFAPPDEAETDFTTGCTGHHDITLTVTDKRGTSSAVSFPIEVNDGTGGAEVLATINSWPQIASVSSADAQLKPDDTTLVAVVATDPDDDPLGYAWESTDCPGYVGNEATVTFTAPHLREGESVRPCTLRVRVTDGRGGHAHGKLILNVTTDPSVPAPHITRVDQPEFAASGAVVDLSIHAENLPPLESHPLFFTWGAGYLGTADLVGGSSASYFMPLCAAGVQVPFYVDVSNDVLPPAPTRYTFVVTCR